MEDHSTLIYANRHIPKFLALSSSSSERRHADLQVVTNGCTVTAASFRSGRWSLNWPLLVTDLPETIGMQLPQSCRQGAAVRVRDIADIVGHTHPVSVMDVEYQEELEGWCLIDLVEYFEDDERLAVVQKDREAIGLANTKRDKNTICNQQQQEQLATTKTEPNANSSRGRERVRRQASVNFLNKTRHRVLNQITFEFSHTQLTEQVRAPQFVCDLDWIHQAWPTAVPGGKPKPRVQKYCLTSAAGCYTDFHVDFGGTSVWYHVLSGSKIFCLIPPTDSNLKVYEQWMGQSDQETNFLPDLLSDPTQVIMLRLLHNETFVIPSGWIHAVYTPEDSLVFGGNFLHGMDMRLQIASHEIEQRSGVRDKFRFPDFVPMHFYAAGMYLGKLRRGDISQREVDELSFFLDTLVQWWNLEAEPSEQRILNNCSKTKDPAIWNAGMYAAEQNGCDSVDTLLSALREEHARVIKDGICSNPQAPKQSDRPSNKMNPECTLGSSSPRLRLKIKSPIKQKATVDKIPGSPSFRIRLSAPSPRRNTNAMMSRSKPREDMNSFVNEKATVKDDEWLPTAETLSNKKTEVSAKQAPPKRKSKPKAQLSSRQRLLKKAKW